MKAILVIDVPTESLENVIASVNICEQREGYNIILKRMGKMSLKPLPPHEKALMFGSEFEFFSEKVGEIVLDAIGDTDESSNDS